MERLLLLTAVAIRVLTAVVLLLLFLSVMAYVAHLIVGIGPTPQ